MKEEIQFGISNSGKYVQFFSQSNPIHTAGLYLNGIPTILPNETISSNQNLFVVPLMEITAIDSTQIPTNFDTTRQIEGLTYFPSKRIEDIRNELAQRDTALIVIRRTIVTLENESLYSIQKY